MDNKITPITEVIKLNTFITPSVGMILLSCVQGNVKNTPNAEVKINIFGLNDHMVRKLDDYIIKDTEHYIIKDTDHEDDW